MKNLLLTLGCIALAFLPACTNNSKEMERQSKIEANKALAKKWILEGWNQNRNREVVADVFAQNWVDGNPTFPDQPKGIEGAMYYVEVYRKVFPDIQFALTHIIAEEDIVTFRFTAEATHKGDFMGIPPTGKRVKFSGIVIHRIENGRFAESWNEIDLLGVRQQLTSSEN
ncbi:MAG: ester cyclase [Phycisphaerae bacterium]|nr:ester cyclase [Saprospiraceae bacterium]